MTDKEKIINEIKLRLHNNESILNEGINNIPNLNGRIEEEKSLLAFINSLPEEPVSEDLEKAADDFADKHSFTVPYDGSNKFYDEADYKASEEGFIAGAQWQKKQMIDKACEWLKEHVHEYVKLSTISGFYVGTGRLLDDFCKAMEEND